jgi:hypothetical protein
MGKEIRIHLGNRAVRLCLEHLKNVDDILRQMKLSQPDFNYKMAVEQAEILFHTGRHEELSMLFELITRYVPGYDEAIIGTAHRLLAEAWHILAVAAKVSPTDIGGSTNDNINNRRGS